MGFVGKVCKFITNAISTGIALVFSGIILITFLIVLAVAVLFWPFYSYASLSSFVNAVNQDYPAETNLDIGFNWNQEDFNLITGRLYCSAKFIHLEDALINSNSDVDINNDSDVDINDKQLEEAIYRNADKYLCPGSIWSNKQDVASAKL